MEKQTSLLKKILACKDYIALCKLTSSSYFKVSTLEYQQYLYRSFTECVKSVRLFLYKNNIISGHVRINPYIEVSTNKLYIDLTYVISYSDHFEFKYIGLIYIDYTYSFQTILNKVLFQLLEKGYIKELPF